MNCEFIFDPASAPPAFSAPVKPIPPVTINAPVVVLVLAVPLVMLVSALNVLAPAIVCAPPAITNCTSALISGIVYTRDADGAGDVIVVVFDVPSTS